MNSARIRQLIRERRELLAGTEEGKKFLYRIGGGSCYYVVYREEDGAKYASLRGPVRKEIAKALVEKINRTTESTGQSARYLGTRSAAKTLALL
jgi:hypothetical protein